MTVFISRIERVRGIQESSFAADMSGSMASFFEVPFHEGSIGLTLFEELETPMHGQQRIGGYPLGVLLPRRATLNLTVNLETFTTKATSGQAATSHWLAEMLEVALGGSHIMTGTAITTGATTTVAPVSTATTLRPGAAIGFASGGNSELECREIESKSGSNITVKLATSNSPANSSTVYGSTTIFAHTRMTGATSQSMQFAVEGQNTEDRWLLRGGALDSLALKLGPNAIPTLTFSWKFPDWDQADGTATATDLTGSELGSSTYTNTVTLVEAESEFRVATVGTSTLSGTLYHPSTIEFRPNIVWEAPRTPKGVNTVLQWVRVHAAPVVTGSFVLPYEDNQEWWTARSSRTAKAVWYQIGSSTTDGAVLLSMPSTQITDVQREDVNGIANQRVSFQSRLDTDTTAEANHESMAESPFRIHFF